MRFEKTGNSIPIETNKLVNYCIEQFENFDAKPESKFNPYNNNIIYKTDDNRYIEIPNEIKELAMQRRGKEHMTNTADKSQCLSGYFWILFIISLICFYIYIYK